MKKSLFALTFALVLSACGQTTSTANKANTTPGTGGGINTLPTAGGTNCPSLGSPIRFNFNGQGQGYIVAGMIPSNDPNQLAGNHGSVQIGQSSNQGTPASKTGGAGSIHLFLASPTAGSGTITPSPALVQALSGLQGNPTQSCVQNISFVSMLSGNQISMTYFYLGMQNGQWYGPIGIQ